MLKGNVTLAWANGSYSLIEQQGKWVASNGITWLDTPEEMSTRLQLYSLQGPDLFLSKWFSFDKYNKY